MGLTTQSVNVPSTIINVATQSDTVDPIGIITKTVPVATTPFKSMWRPAIGWSALATPIVDGVLQSFGSNGLDKITVICSTLMGVIMVIMRGIERVRGSA